MVNRTAERAPQSALKWAERMLRASTEISNRQRVSDWGRVLSEVRVMCPCDTGMVTCLCFPKIKDHGSLRYPSGGS